MSKIKSIRPRKLFLGLLSILLVGLYYGYRYNLCDLISFKGENFGIERLYSTVDFDLDGKDDYTEFMLGARNDALNHPKYDPAYFEGGYPPETIGVCTDVVWRAFKEAGYSLRDMVDKDIKLRPEAYDIAIRDVNIDFRRVTNLHVYFEHYALSLTLDVDDIDEWQAGDIVIFDNHIGIISDKRNLFGRAYVIHNGGQPNREEDYFKRNQPIAHYRFDASLIDSNKLIAWS